jgi:hypothetical protein
MKLGMKQKIALLFSLLIIAAGSLFAYFASRNLKPYLKIPENSYETTSVVSEEEKILCPFEGITINENLYKTLAVIYDNHNQALPHTGIASACFVLETLAEGGITRIEAFFAHRQPKALGPVRSARIYFVDFALSYDALLAHCGGSPDALQTLRKLPIDLDQIRFPEPYYRVKNRSAPHNLYGRIDDLLSLAKKRGYDLNPTSTLYFSFRSFELSNETTFVAKKIVVPFSSRSYTYTWIYNEKKGIYIRYTTKGVYIDTLTGSPPPVKNLIVIKAPMKVRDQKGRLDMALNGRGAAWYFYRGTAATGFYEKVQGKPFKFFLKNGEEVQFEPGLIWLEIIPADKKPLVSG